MKLLRKQDTVCKCSLHVGNQKAFENMTKHVNVPGLRNKTESAKHRQRNTTLYAPPVCGRFIPLWIRLFAIRCNSMPDCKTSGNLLVLPPQPACSRQHVKNAISKHISRPMQSPAQTAQPAPNSLAGPGSNHPTQPACSKTAIRARSNHVRAKHFVRPEPRRNSKPFAGNYGYPT